MTTRTPPIQRIIAASLVALCLSACTTANDNAPMEAIYQEAYPPLYHFGEYFIVFQTGFLHIILFIFLFTIFQSWQNGRSNYWCYALYLLITWFYFARTILVYFYPFFPDETTFLTWDDALRVPDGFNDQSEFIFFSLLTTCYLKFVITFFDLESKDPLAARVVEYVMLVLLAFGMIQLIVLFLSNRQYFLIGPPETILKTVFTIPAAWLLVRIIRARLPGASYIVIGSGVLMLGSLFVGLLHFIGDGLAGKRVYLQVGVLIEILFFSAALGHKDRYIRLCFAAALQENQAITQEKEQTEQRFNRLEQRLRKQKGTLHDLQEKLSKRYNGNNSLKPKPAEEETFAQKLERVLAQNYGNPEFRIPDLAALMQLEHQTLNRRIKEQYKVNTVTYFRHYRLEQSKILMLDRYLKLQDIAAKVGFSQYEHYSNSFSKKEGISPEKFRRKLLGGNQ